MTFLIFNCFCFYNKHPITLDKNEIDSTNFYPFRSQLFCSVLYNKKSEQVLSKIMNSYSSKEIGILLNKTEKAIEYTFKNIRVKLGIDSTTPIDVFVRRAKNSCCLIQIDLLKRMN
jgi:hypothetical protein